MSKIEEQKALPRRNLFRAGDEDDGIPLSRKSIVRVIAATKKLLRDSTHKAKKAKGKP